MNVTTKRLLDSWVEQVLERKRKELEEIFEKYYFDTMEKYLKEELKK